MPWLETFLATRSWREVARPGIAGVVVPSLRLHRAIGSRLCGPTVDDLRTTIPMIAPSHREERQPALTGAR